MKLSLITFVFFCRKSPGAVLAMRGPKKNLSKLFGVEPLVRATVQQKKLHCHLCGKAFRNKKSQNHHKCNHVREKGQVGPNPFSVEETLQGDEQKKLQCPLCDKDFRSKKSLSLHKCKQAKVKDQVAPSTFQCRGDISGCPAEKVSMPALLQSIQKQNVSLLPQTQASQGQKRPSGAQVEQCREDISVCPLPKKLPVGEPAAATHGKSYRNRV
jgi:uncharacterized C2H2 Zn-finger protein